MGLLLRRCSASAPEGLSALRVAFGDLALEYAAIRAEIDGAIQQVLARGRFILGEQVAAFEQEFAAWLGIPYAVGCASGTESIALALMALGIGPGHEVILPTNTCVPTATGIRMVGATPVPVDVRPDTLMIDPAQVRRAVTPRTRAVVAVHLYGAPADLDALTSCGVPLIEDCAQGHGARYRGRNVGSFGVFGCFSFYPSKNLGAYGDAGAVVTSDRDLAARVRMLRTYGQENRYRHVLEGLNSRLDEIQAAILRVKLKHVDAWNRRRIEIARQYATGLTGVRIPSVVPHGQSVYHLFPVLSERRDALMAFLANEGIDTLIHYPIPLHLQPCYASWGLKRGVFPISESAAEQLLSLPIHPWMTDEQVLFVVDAVRRFYA